jgi:coenzyme F420-dependent glucose-6-phosphate dehydrogenase
MELGYFLSSEEHAPNDMVRYAKTAEDAGFTFAMISDHYHPWLDDQGQSPFVWAVIGGIATATERLELATAVTCPTVRIHPAIIAQAAATAGAMMPGRFSLGVGSGENLNEHILGDPWPSADVRLEMLEEAVAVIRALWEGGYRSHHGVHYTVENARIYTMPDPLPKILVAGAGPQAARLAAAIGDGFVGVAPDPKGVQTFAESGGRGPRYGKVTVCWAQDEREAVRTAHRTWRSSGIPGQASQELPLPMHFEQVSELVTEDMVGESMICGPDPDEHLEGIKRFVDAGYDHVAVHQVGPDQEGGIRFYRERIMPRLSELGAAA